MKYLTMSPKKLTLLFILCAGFISAQEVTIIDALTSEPIAGVSLYNQTKDRNTISDDSGKCTVALFDEKDIISFQYMGYELKQFNKQELKRKNYIVSLNIDRKELSEVILSIARTPTKKNQIAEKVSVIDAQEIKRNPPQTGADLLLLAPSIRLQKSQGGGGSPVLRGFEANRVLLVVDGIRMNNAIYRSGHLQNAITIDPNAIERVEVVYGSSSVGYGSDALGGVVHYFTKTPRINSKDKIKNSFSSNFNTANESFVHHFDTELSFKNWASYSSISISKFGNLRMGENRKHGYDAWGLVPFYSENKGRKYVAQPTVNSNPNIQKNSSYDQVDVLQKFNIKLPKEKLLTLNIQFSNSSDIPRFDKLNEYKNGELRFAEWHYGPQKRFLFSPQLKVFPKKKLFYKGYFTLAYQNIKESRVSRKFEELNRSHQNENVHVWSFNGDFETQKSEKRSIAYGFEWVKNKVLSSAFSQELILNGSQITGFSDPTSIPTRYPSAGSDYTSAAFYGNFKWDLSPKTTLTAGGRYTHTWLKARWEPNGGVYPQWLFDSPIGNLTAIDNENDALTGSLSITYRPSRSWQLNFLASSGFRSPNIDDLGKIRESRGILLIPNPTLKPEYANNLDFGISYFTPNKKGAFALRLYSTFLTNYIGRQFAPNYTDQLTGHVMELRFDEDIVQTQINDNMGAASIHGASFEGKWNLTPHLTVSSDLTFTRTDFIEGFGPLPSILPFYGANMLQYNKDKLSVRIRNRFSSAKNPEDYSLGGEDGLDETPVELNSEGFPQFIGTPSWSIFNLSGSYAWTEQLVIRAGLENVFDVHYREFASGISASGRSLMFGASLDF
ncbi:MAG: TonB-dependent receptor [Flavobacteriaceae bacterium]|nr:TonB-dependent receptor [Flavobacteriaceae bacterium]